MPKKSIRKAASGVLPLLVDLGCGYIYVTEGLFAFFENIKKQAYEQRVCEVEHGSFTPLVMSLTGGLGNATTVCYKRLASLLSSKREQPYCSTMAWIRCSLSFSLLRSSIQCIRGACSAGGRASKQLLPPIDLVSTEAKISISF